MGATRRITAKTKIFQLKIQLAHIRPPVWRRVLVPGEIDLGELHEVIQTAFGWTNSHLHEFEVGDASYGTPDPDWGRDDVQDESRAKLFRLAGEGSRLGYTYDFGDNWQHQLTIEKVLDPESGTRYPSCTAGRRACPPEDVGGPWGYEDFLDALADPNHEDHDDRIEWIGGSFDPDAFDLTATNTELKALAWAAGPIRTVR
ncbi:MAG: plasmid pRiA4b ORF-3 family protein [Nocardioidaceae bacterium]